MCHLFRRSLASQWLLLPHLLSSGFRTRTCSMTCIQGDIHCPTKRLPRFCAASLTLLLPFPKHLSGLPQAALCLEVNVYLNPFPICAWCKECLSYLQTHQELANSLSEERPHNPAFVWFITHSWPKRNPVFTRYRKLYKGSFFSPCSSHFWCSLWAEANPGGDRWGGALCWFPVCTCWLRKFSFLKSLPEILTPQDSLVVSMYNYSVLWHLQPLGHTIQPVQEMEVKKKDLRGGRWAAPKFSNKPWHNNLL